jgi:hypothetical protein
MNDGLTRFAVDQTGAPRLPGDESVARLAGLAESAIELNAWAIEEGLRGATAEAYPVVPGYSIPLFGPL